MKKLDGLPAKTDLGQEPILQTDQFWIEKTVDTWADVSPSSAAGPHQYHYIPVGLDSYSMVNLLESPSFAPIVSQKDSNIVLLGNSHLRPVILSLAAQ